MLRCLLDYLMEMQSNMDKLDRVPHDRLSFGSYLVRCFNYASMIGSINSVQCIILSDLMINVHVSFSLTEQDWLELRKRIELIRGHNISPGVFLFHGTMLVDKLNASVKRSARLVGAKTTTPPISSTCHVVTELKVRCIDVALREDLCTGDGRRICIHALRGQVFALAPSRDTCQALRNVLYTARAY